MSHSDPTATDGAERLVAVPDVSGLHLAEASQVLRAAELTTGTVTEAYSEQVPAGLIVSQAPAAEETTASGAAIDLVVSLGPEPAPSDSVNMVLVDHFSGDYSPKSVCATQHGLVFAQNMIYLHKVSVFDAASHKPVSTISDKIVLAHFGFEGFSAAVRGGPVEAAATPDGAYVYVSNYSMYGPGFSHPGDDVGGPNSGVDDSYVYRVSTATFAVDQVIKVGAVPKYLAVTPDGRYVLVSNWISYSLSVIDVAQAKVVQEISLGRYPRGIAVDPASKYAYVAIMGGGDIARIDLSDFSVSWIRNVGSSPRHLVLSPDDRYLYATLNASGRIVKIDLAAEKIVGSVATGSQPRSMAISRDGRALYVVNYESDSVSKVRTSDMKELQEIAVGHHPIGITYVDATREIWACCYSGSFWVFRDPE